VTYSTEKMSLSKIIEASDAIIFDLFHTLVSFKSDKTAGRKTSEILGIPEDDWNKLLWESSEDRLRYNHQDDVSIIRKLAHQYDPSILEAKIEEAVHERSVRFRECLATPPVQRINVIRQLNERGHRLILLSNADVMEKRGWNESPFAPFFLNALFSCDIGYIKPEVEAYQTALELSVPDADNVVYVGDGGSNELQGAKACGFTTVMTTEIVGVLWPDLIPGRKTFADYVIGSLEELL
jgi:putative hydrolase of the HAD superfamily